MADDFLEQELNSETPTEHDLDQAYGSQFLQVTDVGDKKIRAKISKVRKQEVKDRETGRTKIRLLVFFETLDKALMLNATNKNVLVKALGKVPVGWKGATVGLYVDPNVTFAGKLTGGLRLKVLTPPAKPAAAAPASKPATTAAAEPWADEKDDPGFDPDLNDPVPDLAAAK